MGLYERFKKIVSAGLRLRNTPIVDEDFPVVRDEFDVNLRSAVEFLESVKRPTVVNPSLPKNCKENAQGAFMPIDRIAPIDLIRDELVTKLIDDALVFNTQLREFKEICFDQIMTFLELSAAEYNRKIGGKKGNLQLISFDGKYKILRKNHDFMTFDERLQIAKDIILECARDWVSHPGVPTDLVILIEGHFRLNKNGQVSVSEVMKVMKYPIQDDRWKEAMRILKDSIQVQSTITYLRFYERIGNTDEYKPISLDIASV